MFGLFHKNLKIDISNRDEIEPQEVFLDNLTKKRDERGEFSDKKIEVPLSRRCFYGLLLSCFLVFSFLFLKSFQLQVVKGEEFSIKAERNRYAFSLIDSSRGVIYDKNFNQLVYNRPVFNLTINSKELPSEHEDIFQKLAKIAEIDLNELQEDFNESNSDSFVVLSDLKHDELIKLEIKTRDLPGIEITKETLRYYDDAAIFSHVIGYLGKISPEERKQFPGVYSLNDWIGKIGLERRYEEELKVTPGRTKIERDVLGRPLSEELISLPQSGNSLVLTIDADLQRKAYSVLEEHLANIGSRNAVVVATNPQTGEVLSLISYPGFDNNVFSSGSSEAINQIFNDPEMSLFNRAIAGLYPVGSTIKPFIALAALEEGIVTQGKQFYSDGSITVANPWDPSNPSVFGDWMAHGWVDLRRALAVSSNVYFYTIGGGYQDQKGLGPELMKRYLNLFGWGSKTEIDLSGEKEGFIPSPEWKRETRNDSWRIGDSYNLSIGQGDIAVTPLQVTYAYNAIANGGRLMRPSLVKKIINDEGEVVQIKEIEVVQENIFNAINLKAVREGMRDAVLIGSATTLQSVPVTCAAKTGTAQISKPGHYHNWVSVFAPYDDPEIVLTVIIEEVEGIRAAALPIARDILTYYFKD